jgi:hypothetical protein
MPNDVELLFCIAPIHRDITARLHAELTDDNLGSLSALARDELATGSTRWTPHYDEALRTIVAAGPSLRLPEDDEAFALGYISTPGRAADHALSTHAAIREQLVAAQALGARTLGDAFDTLAPDKSDAPAWFALVPDVPATFALVRATLSAYLRETAAESAAPVTEQALIAAVELGDRAGVDALRWSWRQLSGLTVRWRVVDAFADDTFHNATWKLSCVPDDVFARIGNPFRPRWPWKRSSPDVASARASR